MITYSMIKSRNFDAREFTKRFDALQHLFSPDSQRYVKSLRERSNAILNTNGDGNVDAANLFSRSFYQEIYRYMFQAR